MHLRKIKQTELTVKDAQNYQLIEKQKHLLVLPTIEIRFLGCPLHRLRYISSSSLCNYFRDIKISQKSNSQLKILGARRIKFHTKGPHIFGEDDWRSGFVYP